MGQLRGVLALASPTCWQAWPSTEYSHAFTPITDRSYSHCYSARCSQQVSELGVLSAFCPDGLTRQVWRDALHAYSRLRSSGGSLAQVLRPKYSHAGTRIADEKTPLPPTTRPLAGRVVKYFADKGFGFVKETGGGNEYFFHRSVLGDDSDSWVRVGVAVQIELRKDRRGRIECATVRAEDVAVAEKGSAKREVTLPVFSMNLPFAALLAHGYKTIESRNGTMFQRHGEGIALLHVGHRTYPDGGKHRQIMRANGASDPEIDRLTSLPSPFRRGQVHVKDVRVRESRFTPPYPARTQLHRLILAPPCRSLRLWN